MIGHRFNWGIVLEQPHLGTLLHGLAVTVSLAAASAVLSLAGGVLLAAGSASRARALRLASRASRHVLRSVPGVFWLLFCFMAVPVLLPEALGARLNAWRSFPFVAAVVGLALNGAPYISDIVLSGLGTVKRDVVASARLTGLGTFEIWRVVLIPGLLVATLPALNARLVHNLKNTALAAVISVPDLTWSAQEVESLTFAGVEATTTATAAYAALSLALSFACVRADRALRARYHLAGAAA
jgi:His/Glu/Gln/Arg/opine family amino acid ABC transporter permease subunit